MSAAGAQTDKMSVVMRFISSQVSKMSSQAGFWACFSQFSSLASGLRVISASPSPGRALYKGVILPGKKKKIPVRCHNEGHAAAIGNLGGEHKSAQENGRELF